MFPARSLSPSRRGMMNHALARVLQTMGITGVEAESRESGGFRHSLYIPYAWIPASARMTGATLRRVQQLVPAEGLRCPRFSNPPESPFAKVALGHRGAAGCCREFEGVPQVIFPSPKSGGQGVERRTLRTTSLKGTREMVEREITDSVQGSLRS
jgi:hypothetical protein